MGKKKGVYADILNIFSLAPEILSDLPHVGGKLLKCLVSSLTISCFPKYFSVDGQ